MSTLLHACMTKATTADGDQLKYDANWVVARRARLKIFDDRLECGDWRIDYADIVTATLHPFPVFFQVTGYILAIKTTDKTYHFGVNPGRFWKGELPFPVVRHEKKRLKYSAFSIITRLIVLGYLGYAIWKWFQLTACNKRKRRQRSISLRCLR